MHLKKFISNQTGLTLVELIATIAISSIVVIILFGILSSAQNESKKQSDKNQDLMNVTLAFKDLTKKAQNNLSNTKVICDTSGNHVLQIGEEIYTFDKEKKTIIKSTDASSTDYLNNINNFSVEPKGNLIEIEMQVGKKIFTSKIAVKTSNSCI